MRYAKISALILCLVLLGASATLQAQQKPFDSAQGKRAITFDDLISMHRVGEAQISPDGKWVAYSVGTPDLAANRTVRNIWLVAISGGEPRQLTRSGRDSRPQWSPDGKKLAFLSSRDGAPQVYLIAVEGGEATKVTSLSTGTDNLRWSPDGTMLAFTSEVYPDCRDDACNEKRDAEREKSKVKARIYETLLYRHWTEWSVGKRSHLFVVPAAGGTPRDLTAGANYDVPPVQRGDANDIAFSPDSKELCYVAVPDKVEATSTNGELFLVPVAGGDSKRITTNPGFDGEPAYSPDGRYIAYHAQLRAGYESDRWRLMLYDRQSGQHLNLTENFDRSVNSLAWAPDSKTIYFNYEDHMQMPIANIAASAGAQPKPIITDTYNGEFSLSGDGKTLVISRSSLVMPAELFVANYDGPSASLGTGTGVRQLTRFNADRLAQLDLPKTEYFSFKSVDGVEVFGMLVKPPNFDAAKKYPVVMLCHGGPQTMWSDNWGYRWNAQMFASPGFVVVMINRRGSTGFGQKFTDEIAGDYGGKAYQDLITGLGYVVGRYPFIDGERAGAAGASFGGFMIDWIATHAQGRFKVLVSHDGVWDQKSFYGATEELWFPEWDMKGTPWTNEAMYTRWSPSTYAAELGKYKTPTLVIHGELDFRVPLEQGLGFYTALQRQGVPSTLLIFPDEGHWVLKPQNSELWYKTVLDWLAKWLK